jgi:FecR protein
VSIEAALDVVQKDAGRRPAPRILWWRYAAVAATVVLAAVGVWRWRQPPKPQWDVVRVAGAPQIGSGWLGTKLGTSTMGASGRIAEGQWLQTDASSRATISVGDIGTVQVDPNTRVRLVVARPNEHRLALARGRISAVVNAPPRLFFVDTEASTAVDLGCAYAMNVDDSGNGLLQVTLGWVALEWSGRESMVPAGASCRTRPKVGPGTPYFDDASDALKQALADFDFEVMKDGGDSSLQTVLDQARVRDTLTLWHLLARVDPANRLRVFNRMTALVPLAEGVSPEKALQLDPDTLKHWREELAWKW